MHALHNHHFTFPLKTTSLKFRYFKLAALFFCREVDYAMKHFFCRVVIQCRKTTVLLDDLIYAFKITRSLSHIWVDNPHEIICIVVIRAIYHHIGKFYTVPYCISSTASGHSFEQFSPGTSIAICENQLSGAAPCQCLTLTGMLMQSPGFIVIGSFPHS